MVELILVRHAKSDWGNPALSDHDRPLNTRGERNAPMMAARLAATAHVDRIVSSTAVRARMTAAAFGRELGVEVELDPELYASSPGTLMRTAVEAGVSAGASTIMLVAHDPGLTLLAADLSDHEISHMPTCAIARFSWESSVWGAVDHGNPQDWSLDTPR